MRFVEAMRQDTTRRRQRRRGILSRQPVSQHAALYCQERLRMYAESGNRDFLVDVAKFAMLEWIAQEDDAA